MNTGLEMLETPAGHHALERLGEVVTREWGTQGVYNFPGDVREMPVYVDHFLHRVRSDFPFVVVGPTRVSRLY